MGNDFNIECKFHDKQKVKIVKGFHTGKIGKIQKVYSKGLMPQGLFTAKDYPEHKDDFAYQVEVTTPSGKWFIPDSVEQIECFEGHLEELENSESFIRGL